MEMDEPPLFERGEMQQVAPFRSTNTIIVNGLLDLSGHARIIDERRRRSPGDFIPSEGTCSHSRPLPGQIVPYGTKLPVSVINEARDALDNSTQLLQCSDRYFQSLSQFGCLNAYLLER
jgi:hypothetical protein